MRSLFCLVFLFSLFLPSCASPTVTGLPPSPTVAPHPPTATAKPEPSTATPEPPTPTAAPLKVGYLGADEAGATSTLEAVERVAREFGWMYESVPEVAPDSVHRLVQSGAKVIVVDGGGLQATLAAAAEFPETYFIGIHPGDATVSGGADLPANLLLLGGEESRHDQAGFLAGMVAGFATQTQLVTAIGDPNSAEGLKYRNGFLHGVRYVCPRCRVEHIDVANLSDAAGVSREAEVHAISGSDVFFAAAGPAGEAALVAAAGKGAWVVGSRGDAYVALFGDGSAPGADRALTSVYWDAGPALHAALLAYHDGEPLHGSRPLDAADGALALAPYRDPDGALSTLDRQDIAAALARLADGSLETGIDPATGEER